MSTTNFFGKFCPLHNFIYIMDTGSSVQFCRPHVSGGPGKDVNYVSVMINTEKSYLQGN